MFSAEVGVQFGASAVENGRRGIVKPQSLARCGHMGFTRVQSAVLRKRPINQ